MNSFIEYLEFSLYHFSDGSRTLYECSQFYKLFSRIHIFLQCSIVL